MKATLAEFEVRYEDLMKYPPSTERGACLLELLYEMEKAFGIPCYEDGEWGKVNPEVRDLHERMWKSWLI